MSVVVDRIPRAFVLTGRSRAWVALVLFAVLIAGLNWKLVTHLSTTLIGYLGGDIFEVQWQLSWVKDAIFHQGGSALFTSALYYPHGWYLASGAQPVWWMIALSPFTYLIGAVATHNLAMLATMVIGAWGAFLLVQHFTHNFMAAFLAGCAFALTTALSSHQGGHMHILLSAQWLPYVALFSHKSLENLSVRRYRYWIITSLFLALSILGHWQFLFMAPLIPICVVGFSKAEIRWPSRLRLLLFIGAVSLLLLSPFALYAKYARDQMFTKPPYFSSAVQDQASLSPDRLLEPSSRHPWWGEWASQTFPVNTEADQVSLGYGVVLLAVIGSVRGLPVRRTYLILATLALLLGLGLTFHWNAQQVRISLPEPLAVNVRAIEAQLLDPKILPQESNLVVIPMPLALLTRVIPLFNEARIWGRYAIVIALGAGVLAGLGADVLIRRWPTAGQWMVLFLVVMVLIESYTVNNTTRLVEVADNTRPIDYWLATQSPPVTIIEYPLPDASKLAMYRQSIHRQNVVNGYMSVDPTYYVEAVPVLGTWPNSAALDLLRIWKVDYVLVNGTNDNEFVDKILPGIRTLKGLCWKREDNEPDKNRHTYLLRILTDGQTCEAGNHSLAGSSW